MSYLSHNKLLFTITVWKRNMYQILFGSAGQTQLMNKSGCCAMPCMLATTMLWLLWVLWGPPRLSTPLEHVIWNKRPPSIKRPLSFKRPPPRPHLVLNKSRVKFLFCMGCYMGGKDGAWNPMGNTPTTVFILYEFLYRGKKGVAWNPMGNTPRFLYMGKRRGVKPNGNTPITVFILYSFLYSQLSLKQTPSGPKLLSALEF